MKGKRKEKISYQKLFTSLGLENGIKRTSGISAVSLIAIPLLAVLAVYESFQSNYYDIRGWSLVLSVIILYRAISCLVSTSKVISTDITAYLICLFFIVIHTFYLLNVWSEDGYKLGTDSAILFIKIWSILALATSFVSMITSDNPYVGSFANAMDRTRVRI